MQSYVLFYSPEEKTLLCTIPFRHGLTVQEAKEHACKLIDAGFDPKNMVLRHMDTETVATSIEAGASYYLTTSKQDYPSKMQTFFITLTVGSIFQVESLPDKLLETVCKQRNLFVEDWELVPDGEAFRLKKINNYASLPVAELVFPNGTKMAALVNADQGTPAQVFLERISWNLPESFPFQEYRLDRDVVYPGDICVLIHL